MRDPNFRGDPYHELGVKRDASGPAIKRRWRELAREHHPDRAAGDRQETDRLTGRMARINAAYDLLRDPQRRARYDQSVPGRRAAAEARREATGRAGGRFREPDDERPSGPPPPPVSRPVTGRFDTSAAFRPRNTTIPPAAAARDAGRAHRPGAPTAPRVRREPAELRASTPSGPVQRQRSPRMEPVPSLREAREAVLEFGKHRGYTLGEVELLEPAYIDWIAQTITRDRDLVQKARVIQSEMDRQGVARRARPAQAGFGGRAASG